MVEAQRRVVVARSDVPHRTKGRRDTEEAHIVGQDGGQRLEGEPDDAHGHRRETPGEGAGEATCPSNAEQGQAHEDRERAAGVSTMSDRGAAGSSGCQLRGGQAASRAARGFITGRSVSMAFDATQDRAAS